VCACVLYIYVPRMFGKKKRVALRARTHTPTHVQINIHIYVHTYTHTHTNPWNIYIFESCLARETVSCVTHVCMYMCVCESGYAWVCVCEYIHIIHDWSEIINHLTQILCTCMCVCVRVCAFLCVCVCV